MALDLFKRVETRKGLFAVEKITLIYNLLTSILILFLFQRMDHPWHMLLDRAMIAAMTFLLMYLYRLAPCKFSAFVRIVIQMSLLSYWYPDTFEFNRFFPNLDHVFAITEQFIFNGQPAIWFCHTFPHLLVSEAFNMGYFFYYPMMLIVALFYFIYRGALHSGVQDRQGAEGGDRRHERRDGARVVRFHEYARNGRERAEKVCRHPSFGYTVGAT